MELRRRFVKLRCFVKRQHFLKRIEFPRYNEHLWVFHIPRKKAAKEKIHGVNFSILQEMLQAPCARWQQRASHVFERQRFSLSSRCSAHLERGRIRFGESFGKSHKLSSAVTSFSSRSRTFVLPSFSEFNGDELLQEPWDSDEGNVDLFQ